MDAQWFVFEADVIGPGQDLRMCALDVVTLVERVDDDLPVSGQDGGPVGPHPHSVQVVRGQERGQRVKVLEEWWCSLIQAHPHKAPPAVDAYMTEVDVLRHGRELFAVDDFDQPAVEVVAPGM